MSSTERINNHAAQIASELSECTTKSNQSSHTLCQYVLENVLLHQAAAQQLQVRVEPPEAGSHAVQKELAFLQYYSLPSCSITNSMLMCVSLGGC